jgi:hypothetical protein
MFPSDPSFNELHIREKQILLGEILIWMNDLAQDAETSREQNDIINRVIDLIEIDRILNYFIDFERSSNRFLNEARLENAKLRYENQEMKKTIDNLQKALDNAASNI